MATATWPFIFVFKCTLSSIRIHHDQYRRSYPHTSTVKNASASRWPCIWSCGYAVSRHNMLVRCNSAKLHRLLDSPLRDILIARFISHLLEYSVQRIEMEVEGHLKEERKQTMCKPCKHPTGWWGKSKQDKTNKQTNPKKEGTISGMWHVQMVKTTLGDTLVMLYGVRSTR